MKTDALLPVDADAAPDRQRLFARYFTAILVDLVVLNLFVEFSKHVNIDSFFMSLLAAILLQILLKVTLAIEHRVAAYFKAKPGRLMTFFRWFFAWVVLFGSKFVILEALSFTFGDKVRFEGPWHGIVALILVLVVMLVAEELVARLYRRLGK